MKKDLNMKVNVLPVLTYNFLHVNDSTITGSDIAIDSLDSPEAQTIPNGVTVQKGLSFEEAGEVFRVNKDRINIVTKDSVEPNAHMAFRDEPQAIRTGMGNDVDELMSSVSATVDVYTVEEDAKVEKPIFIQYKLDNGQGSLSGQVIHAKKNSDVTVIMDYSSAKDSSGFHGVSTRLLAEEGAKITVVKVQLLGNDFIHFDDIGGACYDKGTINVISLELGAKKSWTGCYINLSEKDSEFNSNMGYLVRDDHNLDINYVTDHRGQKTNALMQFKGVLMDKASKTFRGTIDFKNGSAGSAGDEQEDALLLSPDVINKTMPVILCQEEDVDGRHGATIGQLGEDLLFYMQSRGIDEEEAKKIMIKARLESVANMIPDEEIRNRVQEYIHNIV